jgi:hypothetical protein
MNLRLRLARALYAAVPVVVLHPACVPEEAAPMTAAASPPQPGGLESRPSLPRPAFLLVERVAGANDDPGVHGRGRTRIAGTTYSSS